MDDGIATLASWRTQNEMRSLSDEMKQRTVRHTPHSPRPLDVARAPRRPAPQRAPRQVLTGAETCARTISRTVRGRLTHASPVMMRQD